MSTTANTTTTNNASEAGAHGWASDWQIELQCHRCLMRWSGEQVADCCDLCPNCCYDRFQRREMRLAYTAPRWKLWEPKRRVYRRREAHHATAPLLPVPQLSPPPPAVVEEDFSTNSVGFVDTPLTVTKDDLQLKLVARSLTGEDVTLPAGTKIWIYP